MTKETSKILLKTELQKRGHTHVSEIGAILSEFPFGNKKIQVGLMLWEAMFLNGVLHSIESWHGITSTQNWTRTPGIVKGNKSLNLVWFE